MDYIREELLRQNRILKRLMVGEDSQNERDTTEQDRRVFPAEKELDARTRWSRAAVEELTAAGITVAETGGDENPRLQRKPESDSGETGWNSFYVAWKGSKEREETTNIRAMSRSIQRDARRYDGGFSIY